MPNELKKPAEPLPAQLKEADDLMRRAEQGDTSTLPIIRDLLDSPDFLNKIGNLALNVQQTIIDNSCGKNLFYQEGLTRKMDELRKELSGESPSPLEKLLVDRIALCWLSLHDVEIRYARAKDLSLRQTESYQNRIDRRTVVTCRQSRLWRRFASWPSPCCK